MTNTLAFISIKGGVGKTTLALETATTLANNFNKRVLLVDANFSAPNIGLYLDLTNEKTLHDALSGTLLHNTIYESYGVDVVPASINFKDKVNTFKLKEILAKYKSRYDFIILDSSPNYEELKPVINAADRVFIVTTPDHVTLTTSLKAAEAALKQNTAIEGIIVNRIRSPKHEYNLKDIETISEIPVMARIPDHKIMAKATNQKTPITILESSNTISKEIRRLASAICGAPEDKTFFEKIMPLRSTVRKERVNRDILRDNFYECQL